MQRLQHSQLIKIEQKKFCGFFFTALRLAACFGNSPSFWLGLQMDYDLDVAEISCPTKYFAEASSINLQRSIKYGFGCLHTALTFRLAKMKLITSKLFSGQE